MSNLRRAVVQRVSTDQVRVVRHAPVERPGWGTRAGRAGRGVRRGARV